MKKKILSIFICIIAVICVACSCSKDSSAIGIVQQASIPETFSLVEHIDLYSSSDLYILVDNDTKVMYMCIISDGYYNSGSSSIIPLYNADGTLKLYDK